MSYFSHMEKKTSNQVLWENIAALMTTRYGGENLGRFAREAGVGAATLTRIKAQATSIGTDHLDKIASAFRIEAWQLLCPDFISKGNVASQAAVTENPPDVKMLKRALEYMPPEGREKAANAALAALFQHLPLEVSPGTPEPAPDRTRDNISG